MEQIGHLLSGVMVTRVGGEVVGLAQQSRLVAGQPFHKDTLFHDESMLPDRQEKETLKKLTQENSRQKIILFPSPTAFPAANVGLVFLTNSIRENLKQILVDSIKPVILYYVPSIEMTTCFPVSKATPLVFCIVQPPRLGGYFFEMPLPARLSCSFLWPPTSHLCHLTL